MNSHRKDWLFTQQQLMDINNQRISTFPPNFNIENERKLINYFVLLSKELLKIFDIEDQLSLLCYSAQLFKRLCLRNSIFKLGNMQQLCVSSMYLGLKLFERSEQNIIEIVNRLKSKPKYKGFIHYGDEGYSRQELFIASCLNFEIQIPCFYQTIQAINNLIQVRSILENNLYERYLLDVRTFMVTSLQNDLIFQIDHWGIAMAIIELALHQISQYVFSNTHVSASMHKLFSMEVAKNIKSLYQASQIDLLILQFAQKSGASDVILVLKQRLSQIQEVVSILKQVKDIDPSQGLQALKLYEASNKVPPPSGEFKRPENKLRKQGMNAQSPELRKIIRKE